jgi:hypothetical protein
MRDMDRSPGTSDAGIAWRARTGRTSVPSGFTSAAPPTPGPPNSP